jgi:hypothetical protein
MPENLFILFTHKDGSPEEVRKLLGESFANDKVIGINESLQIRGWHNFHDDFQPHLLIIHDGDDLSDQQNKTRLKEIIINKSNIYVVYHGKDTENNIISRQKEVLRRICSENKKLIYEAYEHHTPGNNAADSLNKIATFLNNSSSLSEYENALNDLITKSNYTDTDPYLEIKLELLHQCLTLEGKSEAEKKFSELIELIDDNNVKRKISEAFENMIRVMEKENIDCLSDNDITGIKGGYIGALENFRKSLEPL